MVEGSTCANGSSSFPLKFLKIMKKAVVKKFFKQQKCVI